MPKLLMLRGRLDSFELKRRKGRDKDNIDQVDDLWALLWDRVTQKIGGYGEVWWEGKDRIHNYRDNFKERWVSKFNGRPKFYPDIVFARGGFPFYNTFLKRTPNSYRMYYGAGARFMPKDFTNYKLILVDTKKQQRKVRAAFPKIKCKLLVKPAADTIFKPMGMEKKWDVIFIGNASQARMKGHKWFFKSTKDSGLNILNVGIRDKELVEANPHIEFTGSVPRTRVAEYINQSKIGVCCSTKIDSQPRIIAEYLACGIPIIVLNKTNCNKKLYVTEQTGMVSSMESFVADINNMLVSIDKYSPFEYYKENLSLDVAAERLVEVING